MREEGGRRREEGKKEEEELEGVGSSLCSSDLAHPTNFFKWITCSLITLIWNSIDFWVYAECLWLRVEFGVMKFLSEKKIIMLIVKVWWILRTVGCVNAWKRICD